MERKQSHPGAVRRLLGRARTAGRDHLHRHPGRPGRRQALEAGDIDGYDLVDPADADALEGAGFQIMRRPAFNVGYVGFQQNHPPFENINIRKAIAHAINKENLIQTNYPEGTEIATQFMPPELFVGPTM